MPDEKKVGEKIFAALQRIETEQKAQRELLQKIRKEVSADLDLEGDGDGEEETGEDGNEG